MRQYSSIIIKEFLEKNNISLNLEDYILLYKPHPQRPLSDLPNDIVDKIISDAFKFSYRYIQEISDELFSKFDVHLSRIQKKYLKNYLLYKTDESLDSFRQSLNGKVNYTIIDYIDERIKNTILINLNGIDLFLDNLRNAISKGKSERIQDYLMFLYSRLLGLNEKKRISIWELFIENKKEATKELSSEECSVLENQCNNFDKALVDKETAVHEFNRIYNNILNKNGKDANSLIYIEIDQIVADQFSSINDLVNYLFLLIERSYEKLSNHRTLLIRIKNIIFEKNNIKWLLYAYITIYCEKFKEASGNRNYYKAEEIFVDILENIYGINMTTSDKFKIKKYYLSESKELPSWIAQDDKMMKIANYYKNLHVGFSFIDCLVLNSETDTRNSTEIEFIENNQELLLIFQKHELYNKKLPCPVCGSLKVSGNSYPEICIKSWECKNPHCFERSKTNRGKRYSAKTNIMQDEFSLSIDDNIIPKTLINLFRRDIVDKYNDVNLLEMAVKYYSYAGDKITFINCNINNDIVNSIAHGRDINLSSLEEVLKNHRKPINLYDKLLNTSLFDQIYFIKDKNKRDYLKRPLNKFSDTQIELINDDSLYALRQFPENSIDHMVTSPPYYNAREYSQWVNLYHYLNDMFNIIRECHRVLVGGGVFFYNIGDIFDNENVVSKSTMGYKRIPLGAYTVLLFKKAGFKLLDNIIWHKGEPQSNRHKNDGMYYPYYQRPANCYEHMFIFKKEGKLKLIKNISENKLTGNIQKFSPVIKIGANGVNKHGHAAPFPDNLPILSISCFTNSGEKVLDPFSGSGTVPLVAKSMNRKGIGIELSKEYYDLSLSKINALAKTKPLFEIGYTWSTTVNTILD